MNDIIVDKHYEGYEGQPEIRFITSANAGQKLVLRIWDGFFYNIMQAIQPEADEWHGLAYYYNMDEGWYEESPWQIPNVLEAYDQLKRIDIQELDQKTKDVLADICILLEQGISMNEAVWIAYD